MGAQGEGRPERIILGDPKFQVKKNRVTIDKIVASTFSESIISIASIRENDAMTFLCQDSLGEMLDKFQAQFLFAAGVLEPTLCHRLQGPNFRRQNTLLNRRL